MKTGFWDRVLVYLYVLITLVLIAATMLLAFGFDAVGMLIAGLSANAPGLFWRLIFIGLFAMIAVLGVYVAVVITPSRKKKNNFVTISSDNGGQVRVSLPAIREMAGQAIRNAKGIEDVVIDIAEASDAIEVNVAMDVECGVHVPTVTMNMQRAIKANIENNCGISVRKVTVDVKKVLPSADPASIEEVEVAPVMREEAPAAEAEEMTAEEVLPVEEEAAVESEAAGEPEISEEPEDAEDTAAEEEGESAEEVCTFVPVFDMMQETTEPAADEQNEETEEEN